VYSTGNAFADLIKFNSKNYLVWRRNMETQLQAVSQWEVVDGTITAPAPVDPVDCSPDKTCELNAWKLRSAHAYAEIVLCVEDDYGETIATRQKAQLAVTEKERGEDAQIC
jgi:hypothetical protein